MVPANEALAADGARPAPPPNAQIVGLRLSSRQLKTLDGIVLKLAVAAGCDYIVTHNVADFVSIGRFGVKVMRPGRFLRQLEETS